jgi:hypothetical protein
MELVQQWCLYFNEKGFQTKKNNYIKACNCYIYFSSDTNGFYLWIDDKLAFYHEIESDVPEKSVINLKGYSSQVFVKDVRKLRLCRTCDDFCVGRCSLCLLTSGIFVRRSKRVEV